MGKLGGSELNYSSDIDLIFLYGKDGETDGGSAGNRITNREFFHRLTERVTREVDAVTPDGRMYRVDLRLRPEGATGSLVRTLASTLAYYRRLGETWERQAHLKARVVAGEALGEVGIPNPERRLDQFPHELSGGMRQRVMIAMALLCKPKLLLADEPTTALDVTIQAQILELMKDLQHKHGTAIVLVTHDLGVVAGMSDRVHVMYAGRLVETAATEDLFARPRHPYTEGLLASVPKLDGDASADLRSIEGQPPDLAALPPGCAFAPRCAYETERCRAEVPALAAEDDPDAREARHTACFESARLSATQVPR
jgi:oligopeptide transport system ATP-binding protein